MRNWTYHPRPEYPRPDRQRSFIDGVDWLNLNGPWQFRFDGDRRGVEESWFRPDQPAWREQILVPFCWESLAAWGEGGAAGNGNYFAARVFRNPLEVTRFNYRRAARYEVGWYRRTIEIPDNPYWEGKRAILTIGAADYFTDCWCNGQHLGRHEGGYTPFEFDLTDALETGSGGRRIARVVIRVEDPMQNHEQPVGKQWRWYTTVSGIWQTVFLEPRSEQYVERFEILPDLSVPAARMRFFCRGGEQIHAEVTTPDGEVLTGSVRVDDDGYTEGYFRLEKVVFWDPTDPQLYRLKVTLRSGGKDVDVVHGYFGMRTLRTEAVEGQAEAPAMLVFNDQPIYLRGALYQSYNPGGIYTAMTAQLLKDDILTAKRAGFDFLRVHIKVDDPLLYYYADTLGILLMADFPNFGEGGDTPLGRGRYERLMHRAIQRDFNHPSIIAWCLFNETWGFGGQVELVKHFEPVEEPALLPEGAAAVEQRHEPIDETSFSWVRRMWNLAKELDPTRLVEDMSVVSWDHLELYGHGDTDINSWHFYIDDYHQAKEHIARVVRDTYAGSDLNYIPGFKQGNQPLINSEYGGVGALDGDRDISWSFKFLTNELRLHGKLSAYIFTQLHDVEWEYNGFVNYDRSPKEFGYDPSIVNQGDVLPIDAPPIQRCVPGQEVPIDIYSSHFSRRHRENMSLHWRFSGVDSLGMLYDNLESGSLPIAFTQHRVELAHRLPLRMPATTMAGTLWVWALTQTGEIAASNYIQFLSTDGLPTREEIHGGLVLRMQPHEWKTAEWTAGHADAAWCASKGMCYGDGSGFFEWEVAVGADELARATGIKVLCEAASHRRDGIPQTDHFRHPTSFEMQLNGIRVYQSFLPNHPHDGRGALSFLRGEKGGYGYLSHGTVEGSLLSEVRAAAGDGPLRLRCLVPAEAPYPGGLMVYGGDAGRFPVPPTLIIEF
jgi:hypothetical protein